MIGYYLTTIFDYKKSNDYLIKALSFTPNKGVNKAALYDNIGVNFLRLSDFNKSKKYFDKALQLAVLEKDRLREAKVYGNLAEFYYLKKDYPSAINVLKKDIQISRIVKNDKNLMYALILLGKVYLENHSTQLAKQVILEAKAISETKAEYLSSKYQALKLLQNIYHIEHDDRKELQVRQSLDTIILKLVDLDGFEVLQTSKWRLEELNSKLNLANEKTKVKEIQLRNSLLVISTLLLLSFAFYQYRLYQRNIKIEKAENKSKLSEYKRKLAEADLKLSKASYSLGAYIDYIKDRNRQIEELQDKVLSSNYTSVDDYSQDLEELLQSHLMTDENWFRFKAAFKKRYPNYIHYINTEFPGLTDSNLRLVFLCKLGLTNREIANLLGVTPEAIKKAKQRLRIKLEEKFELLFN